MATEINTIPIKILELAKKKQLLNIMENIQFIFSSMYICRQFKKWKGHTSLQNKFKIECFIKKIGVLRKKFHCTWNN